MGSQRQTSINPGPRRNGAYVKQFMLSIAILPVGSMLFPQTAIKHKSVSALKAQAPLQYGPLVRILSGTPT
jgi:hypothetical protein